MVVSDLAELLRRWERGIGERFPKLIGRMRPGLDDAGVAAFAAALAPLRVPAEVETLYRWHDGGSAHLFDGSYLMPSAEALETRSVMMDAVDDPPALLPLLGPQATWVVTLDVPGCKPSPSTVWLSGSHEEVSIPVFMSIASMVEVCVAALERNLLDAAENTASLVIWGGETIFRGPGWDDLLITTDAATPQWRAHLEGRSARPLVPKIPHANWPLPWLVSYGLDPDPRPHGATHTVAELVALSAHGPAVGTVRARSLISTRQGPHALRQAMRGRGHLIVDDGTARVTVAWDSPCPGGPPPLDFIELDLYLTPATAPSPAGPDHVDGTCTGARLPEGIQKLRSTGANRNLIPTTEKLPTNI